MSTKRIVDIDVLRFLAIILMILFHFAYDLNEFAGVNVDYTSLLWFSIGKAAALLFIFVSGISSCLSRKVIKRGLIVLLFAMIITITTCFVDQREYVRFGILHFLGVSMILSVWLKKRNKIQLTVIAVIVLLLGFLFKAMTVSTKLLLPLGLMYNGFVTMDYYPLFPYLTVFIFGILAYKVYYYKGESLLSNRFQKNPIMFISSHSLFIYLIHQPLLLGTIYICNILFF